MHKLEAYKFRIKALRELSEAKFEALKNTFTTVKYLFFDFFHLQLTGLIQNERNTAISKHFTKPMECIRTTIGTIFGADV